MTSYAPTPADFMRMTDGPDFDPAELRPDPRSLHVPAAPSTGPATVDLTEVLERLDRIAGMIQAPVELERQVAELHEAHGDVAAARDVNARRIEQTLEAIKKSTSKVAKDVREILQPEPLAPAPVEPSTESAQDPEAGKGALIVRAADAREKPDDEAPLLPAHDADVEVWRQFVRGRKSFLGTDVNTLNRSQIRTMLGVQHPGEGGDE